MTTRRFAPARPVAVAADPAGGAPRALWWRGRRERVRRVAATWELAEGWWRGDDEPGVGPTRRRYYRIVTHSGLRCVVYRDLAAGGWFLEGIVD